MQDLGSLRFGRVELQVERRCLWQDGTRLAIGTRAFDLLVALVQRRDRIVTKGELLDVVWPGLVVEENNLQVQISGLRKLLGPHAIATIPGRGYRFTAAVDGAAQVKPKSDGPVPLPTATRIGVPTRPLTNLPKELGPLYGREVDLQALCTLIHANRCVTVVGAGGIGKSRLAQAVAHSQADCWSDGVWMVELAGLSDPELLPNAVAQTLAVNLAGQGVAVDELVAAVAHRALLLVLDNCEHLLDAAARLAQAIISGAPQVTLLSTSQEPLRLPFEQQYRIVPLAVPPATAISGAREFGAVALFEARARAVDPRFTLSDESLSVVIDICHRLDGLPLAIELAAARVATLGLRPLRDKLDARFKLLTGGSRATLRRHQTLRAAVEWSHNLLNDGEKAVFRRLGVFAGGFTMDLAQAVAADEQLDEWAVLEHLSALVDKSLVVAEAGDTPRYRLLESARAFALERLAAVETAETLKRHAHAMAAFLQRVDGANIDCEIRSDQYAALVLPELDNLRAARAWANGDAGDPQVAVALAACAGSLIDYAVECVEWLPLLKQYVESGVVDTAVAARYWGAMAATNMVGHVLRTVQVDAARRAVALYRAAGESRRVFSSLINLSRQLAAQGHYDAAQGALDEARSLIRPDWPVELHYRLLLRDSSLARNAGRIEQARALIADAIRLSASAGDWRLEAIARNNLVDLSWQLGPIDEAAGLVRKLAEELRAKPAADIDMDIVFTNLIGILSEMRRIDEATAAARELLPILRRTRHTFVEEWVHLFWRRGQTDVATLLLGASDAKQARLGTPLQDNERRLIAQARAGLEVAQDPRSFASGLAAGAVLAEGDLLDVMSKALAQTSANEATCSPATDSANAIP
jgi:predicted ATPase/DNA-binding winged helix-turn-helix (wHTH) protein